MRIAIDLTSVPPRLAGVGYYLVALVDALQTVDPENEYLLIVARDRAAQFPIRSHRFSVKGVADRSRAARMLWEQTLLPRLVAHEKIEVLHSPHYTRPLVRLPCASVVGLMDLTYFLLPGHHTWARRNFFRRMVPLAAARADRIIAISESTKRDAMLHLGIPSDKIDPIPLAVSPQYRADIPHTLVEQTRSRLRLPAEYVLFVGTIEPRKNIVRLVQAYGEAVRDEPAFPPLVLVGMRGWHAAELDRALVTGGVRDRVMIAGYVPEDDLPCVYAGARFFVYPSLYEGFGIPVLEALACGVPTITSSTSSMPEVAGDAALLVDPEDRNALCATMLKLFRDRRLADDLRGRGPVRASAFSWARTAELTIDTYRRALAQMESTACR